MYKKKIAWFEIFLLVSASLAFSSLVHQSTNSGGVSSVESSFVRLMRQAFVVFFGGNLVSAEEPLWTCSLDKNGARCQEYGAAVCDANCTTSCFQGARRDFADCREGTCIDSTEGTCAPNTPQALCQTAGGVWDARSMHEIPACRPGCCLLGSQALFRTEQSCNVLRQRFNAAAVFRPVTSELECLSLANQGEEGACVLEEVEPQRYGCRFTTREQCGGMQGTFYRGLLCSHPTLNTTCTRQATTNCVAGKDEVYWFDSCGNRENIYDSLHRDQSWNTGLLLSKNQSCELGSSVNPLLHQSSCGNCNYLGGNRCGTPRSGQDSSPSVGNVICRDLSCIDDDGARRKHGESWCAFNSRIGVQGTSGTNEQRSVDVPGSEQFRKTCANGVITTETCGTFRNQVCVESALDGPGASDFSQAACRPNQWQLCIAANQKSEGVQDVTEAIRIVKEACDAHTDCYMKSVDLRGGRGTFAFSMCLPKYPPAFDLVDHGEEAQALCGFATTACTYVTTKKLFGGSSDYNKQCIQAVGAETMNNLCMSLGDCGAQANIEGEYSGRGFRVTSNRGSPPALSDAYISGLRTLADARPNQRVAPLSTDELAVLLGLPEGASTAPNVVQEKIFGRLGMISGFGGIALATLVYLNPGNLFPLTKVVTFMKGAPYAFGQGEVPALGAYMGAAAGALIGAAGTAYILDALGITTGLPSAVTYALIGLGAFSGFAIGGNLASGVGIFANGGWLITSGVIGLIALVVIIGIFVFMGIGKKKETKVTFSCLPWQPPLGGARCDACGAAGVPCTKYACQSLGQACRYIEDSAEDSCVNAGSNDVTAPLIQEDASILLPDYQYEHVSERGYRLRGPAANGCLPRFSPVRLGIATNELSQCKVANMHTENFDAMNEYFHRFNDHQSPLFRRNHTMQFSLPSNEAIEHEQQIDSEFDSEAGQSNARFSTLFLPDSSGNVNLYARCTDASGNKNTEEYAITFCVTDEPDRTAPLISSFEPLSPAYVALNATSHGVTFWLNEPAECRWSDGSDQAYGVMAHQASCATSLSEGTVQGWACNATLPAPSNNALERTFYLRCSDQPWLNESSDTTSRNMNSQGVPYVVKTTRTPLQIVSVSPHDETLFVLGLPARINFTVTTTGGAEGQRRYCSYGVGSQFIRFFESGGDIHQQPGITLISEGNYTYPLLCRDSVGNSAAAEIKFELTVDDQGPQITRVYNSNGKLTIITNEFARCAFSLASCSFNFINGTRMTGEQLVHTSPFSSEGAHYIYCRDTFDNPSGCTIVRGGTL